MKSKTVCVNGIQFEFTRKKIKNINLRVTMPNGEVRVSAPLFVPFSAVADFVCLKADWINQRRERIKERNIKEYGTAKDKKEDRKKLKERIEFLLPELSKRTGLYPESFGIRDMKTRWGSCNTKTKKIWIAQTLANYPDNVLNYVLCHELVHLEIKGHGADFKAKLSEICPDWKKIKKEM